MALITTDSVPARDRAAFMSDLVSRQLMDTHVRQVTDGPINGKVRGEMISELPVAEFSGVNMRALRTRTHIARSPFPFYFACVHIAGALSIRSCEQSVTLSLGDIYIGDSLREFEVDVERPFRHLVIRMPKTWLDARVTRPDLIPGTVLRHEDPLSRLFASYLLHGLETAAELSAAAAAMFAAHAVELLAQALGERPSGENLPQEALRAALYVRACRLIALRFAEPGLAPGQIARTIGVSLRLLQRVFTERGETVMGRVWEERANQAAKLLASPVALHRSITEIAFTCGFNDSAHFTRAFAARMSVTPSQWRKWMHEENRVLLSHAGRRNPLQSEF
jgi:AraC family transcriptional regulator, positive regulator of tynA and feaB